MMHMLEILQSRFMSLQCDCHRVDLGGSYDCMLRVTYCSKNHDL